MMNLKLTTGKVSKRHECLCFVWKKSLLFCAWIFKIQGNAKEKRRCENGFKSAAALNNNLLLNLKIKISKELRQ